MADILLLDNIDSFTYHLVDQIRKHAHNVIIYRNTVKLNYFNMPNAGKLHPVIMVSPGPGRPIHAGCMLRLIKIVKGKVPIIGICLGHQAIVEAYGGVIDYADAIFHGKVSRICHDGLEMFHNIPQHLSVARYHSLVCKKCPSYFVVNSYVDNIIMSIRHNTHRVCGFQFHPESILTPVGDQLLEQVIYWAVSKNSSHQNRV
uniref:anthranilate synthase n=1 Tax=Buchnera aphidicola TaxID=9 RepID=Q9JMU6_9GAMM|nr:anthranilate synthase small subunit [Buchnera aphidicola]